MSNAYVTHNSWTFPIVENCDTSVGLAYEIGQVVPQDHVITIGGDYSSETIYVLKYFNIFWTNSDYFRSNDRFDVLRGDRN